MQATNFERTQRTSKQRRSYAEQEAVRAKAGKRNKHTRGRIEWVNQPDVDNE